MFYRKTRFWGPLSVLIILAVSCSGTAIVDQDFFASRGHVIGLVSYHAQYVKTPSGALLSEEAGGGMLFPGDDEHMAGLDERCLQSIERTLKAGPVWFVYDTDPFRNVPHLQNFDVVKFDDVNMDEDDIRKIKDEAKIRNVKLIKRFVAENGLDGAIRIENRYAHVGTSLKLAVKTYWTIYDRNGDTVLFVASETLDKETRSLAYTLDTGLEDEVVSLTGENAEKLIAAIRNRNNE